MDEKTLGNDLYEEMVDNELAFYKPTMKELLEVRPLSWSAVSSFLYNPEQWYEKYILNKRSEENGAMRFGKYVGERLASDPTYLPEVPRGEEYEHELRCKVGNIPCIGFIDSYTKTTKLLLEYKTAGTPWTQKKADGHGQLKFYALMLYLIDGIKPEDITIRLVSMQTKQNQDFTVSFVDNMKPDIFEVKLTMRDILTFGAELQKIVKDMDNYILIHR